MTTPPQKVTIDALSLHAGDTAPQGSGPNAVMHAWFQLFRTAQIHQLDNQALQHPIAAMAELTGTMIPRDGRISLQAKDKSLFVNATKLRLSADELALAKDVFDFFEERGMGGFTIDGPLSADMIRKLLMIMVYPPASERRFDMIDSVLKASRLPFRVNKPLGGGQKSAAELALERRGVALLTYAKLAVLVRTLVEDQAPSVSQRGFLLKKIARSIQTLVDSCIEDDQTFVGAGCVRNVGAYAPQHAVNVAILSIALGKQLGLSKVELADLGLAAMFHDVGMRSCPAAVIEKKGVLDAGERAIVEQHPMWSVEVLLSERVFNKSALSRIVVAFEHHRSFDGSGYPPASRRPDLFARIVAIADTYDALTTDRPWRPAFRPADVPSMMKGDAGKRFDPALLSVFASIVSG